MLACHGGGSSSAPPGAATNTPPIGAGATPASAPGTGTVQIASSTGAIDPNASPPAVHFEQVYISLPAFERPTALVEVPGQATMLVALQEGRIVAFPKASDAAQFATVLDWTSKTSRDGNEEGLLGFALDPEFPSKPYAYVYYSAKPGDRRTVLSRLTLSGSGTALRADPSSELILLTQPQPYSNHKGGQVAFGPDAMLYVGLGDGGSEGDPTGNGQDITRNFLGSILRIDVRNASAETPYLIPADNPFADRTDGTKRETWAYGLRNPWRFSFDRDSGALVVADVGQGDREEIDVVQSGKNYGWNVMEGKACYKPSSGCKQQGLTLP